VSDGTAITADVAHLEMHARRLAAARDIIDSAATFLAQLRGETQHHGNPRLMTWSSTAWAELSVSVDAMHRVEDRLTDMAGSIVEQFPQHFASREADLAVASDPRA